MVAQGTSFQKPHPEVSGTRVGLRGLGFTDEGFGFKARVRDESGLQGSRRSRASESRVHVRQGL